MPRRELLLLLVLTPVTPAQSSRASSQSAESTVVLEGRVVDLRGEGVTLAKVAVATWQEPDAVLARGVCDGEGFFRIARVPRRESWLVLATGPGRCRGQARVAGEPKPIQIDMHDAAVVRGVLHDREGRPVAGATVRGELVARILFDTRSDAKTDAEGRFELAGVPLGLVRFAAVVPGQGIAELRALVAADTEITLAPGEGGVTTLRIVANGLPEGGVDGLSVSILPYARGRLSRLPPPWDKPAFDAKRVSELRGVPDVEFRVSVRARAFAFAPRELVASAGKGPHTLTFTAAALGTNELECRALVRDAGGQPLTGVKLAMRPSNSGERAEAVSGADGSLTFASRLAAGTDVIVESRDERFVLTQKKAEGSYGAHDMRFLAYHECKVDPSATLELRALPACCVDGSVVLADGRPAAFVRVQLEEEGTSRMPRWMGFASATTDRDGKYELRGLHALPQQVRIKVEGTGGFATGEPFELAQPGSRHSAGEQKLAPPAIVEGLVTGADRKPAAGVRVWLRDWDFARNSQQSGSVVEVITDRQGRYRFLGVPPGGAWLQRCVEEDHPGGTRATEPFDVEAGKTYRFDLEVNR